MFWGKIERNAYSLGCYFCYIHSMCTVVYGPSNLRLRWDQLYLSSRLSVASRDTPDLAILTISDPWRIQPTQTLQKCFMPPYHYQIFPDSLTFSKYALGTPQKSTPNFFSGGEKKYTGGLESTSPLCKQLRPPITKTTKILPPSKRFRCSLCNSVTKQARLSRATLKISSSLSLLKKQF